MKNLRSVLTLLFLGICLTGFGQKIKLKKSDVLVDEVVWLKYDGCGMMQSHCSVMNLKGEEIIFIKSIDSPFDEFMYSEVKFLGMNLMVEFERTSNKSIFEFLYKGKVVDENGDLDEEMVQRLVEKYGTPVSDKLNRTTTTNTNTIIIKEEPSRGSGININLGR